MADWKLHPLTGDIEIQYLRPPRFSGYNHSWTLSPVYRDWFFKSFFRWKSPFFQVTAHAPWIFEAIFMGPVLLNVTQILSAAREQNVFAFYPEDHHIWILLLTGEYPRIKNFRIFRDRENFSDIDIRTDLPGGSPRRSNSTNSSPKLKVTFIKWFWNCKNSNYSVMLEKWVQHKSEFWIKLNFLCFEKKWKVLISFKKYKYIKYSENVFHFEIYYLVENKIFTLN